MRSASGKADARPISLSRFRWASSSILLSIFSERLEIQHMSARVLVVDDVPANLRLLQARLAAEYFDVITASNGDEALAICERGECDVVLLDAPGVSGFEVCRRLKSS